MATENVVIIVNSAPSTSITFVPSAASLIAPVPPGTVLGSFTIAPSTWSGAIALGGADEASFVLNEVGGVAELAVGATALTVRTYDLTATATP